MSDERGITKWFQAGRISVRRNLCTRCCRHMGGDGYDVRLGPDLLVALEFELVHGDMRGIVLDFDEQVVVIDAVVLIEVRRSAGDGIGAGTATAGNEVDVHTLDDPLV